jgi:hypothetical protein
MMMFCKPSLLTMSADETKSGKQTRRIGASPSHDLQVKEKEELTVTKRLAGKLP